MPDASMLATTTVLDLFTDKGITVMFSRDADEPDDVPSTMILDRNTWIELGTPRAITCVVVPGDRLNSERPIEVKPREEWDEIEGVGV